MTKVHDLSPRKYGARLGLKSRPLDKKTMMRCCRMYCLHIGVCTKTSVLIASVIHKGSCQSAGIHKIWM